MGENKRIDELNDALYPSYYHYLPIDRDIAAETTKLKADYFGKANDSSDIRCLGNTNTTGAIIPSGKYFYKYDSYHSNRALAKAISNIAVNATLTENTNFKYVTIGEELDSLNAALTPQTISFTPGSGVAVEYNYCYKFNGFAFISLRLKVFKASATTGEETLGYFGESLEQTALANNISGKVADVVASALRALNGLPAGNPLIFIVSGVAKIIS